MGKVERDAGVCGVGGGGEEVPGRFYGGERQVRKRAKRALRSLSLSQGKLRGVARLAQIPLRLRSGQAFAAQKALAQDEKQTAPLLENASALKQFFRLQRP